MGIKFSLSSIRKVAPSHAKLSAEETSIVTAANTVNDLGGENQLDSEEQHILTSCALPVSSDSYNKASAVDKEATTPTLEQAPEEQSLTEGILADGEQARPSSQNEDDQCFLQNMRLENELKEAKSTISKLETMIEFCKYHHVNQIARGSLGTLDSLSPQASNNPNSLLPPRYPPSSSSAYTQPDSSSIAMMASYQKSISKLELKVKEMQQNHEVTITKYQTKIVKLRTTTKTVRMESAIKVFELEQEVFSLKKQLETLKMPISSSALLSESFSTSFTNLDSLDTKNTSNAGISVLEAQSSIATLLEDSVGPTDADAILAPNAQPINKAKTDLQRQQAKLAEMTRSLMSRIGRFEDATSPTEIDSSP